MAAVGGLLLGFYLGFRVWRLSLHRRTRAFARIMRTLEQADSWHFWELVRELDDDGHSNEERTEPDVLLVDLVKEQLRADDSYRKVLGSLLELDEGRFWATVSQLRQAAPLARWRVFVGDREIGLVEGRSAEDASAAALHLFASIPGAAGVYGGQLKIKKLTD